MINLHQRLSPRLQRLWREPLTHFLLAGLAVFLISAWRGEPVDPESRTITIDAAQVSRLVAGWEQAWRRPPTPDEVDGLITDYIKEEIYTREAQRLGLDEDDVIIRRRLRSKMEFLASAALDAEQPSDTTLQAWLDQNPARYAKDTRYTLDQIYLGQRVGANLARAKAALAAGANWQVVGMPLSLPLSLTDASQTDIARQFGESFANALPAQAQQQWQGPIESGYGAHLVRIRSISAAAPPRLADVRQDVENDWRAATRRTRESKAYKALLDGYTVRIARP